MSLPFTNVFWGLTPNTFRKRSMWHVRLATLSALKCSVIDENEHKCILIFVILSCQWRLSCHGKKKKKGALNSNTRIETLTSLSPFPLPVCAAADVNDTCTASAGSALSLKVTFILCTPRQTRITCHVQWSSVDPWETKKKSRKRKKGPPTYLLLRRELSYTFAGSDNESRVLI